MADRVLTASEVAQHRRRNVETDVHRLVYARTTAELRDTSIEAPRHPVKHGML